jgi:hypothetical protein
VLEHWVDNKMQGFQNKLLNAGRQREEFFGKQENFVGSYLLKASGNKQNQLNREAEKLDMET